MAGLNETAASNRTHIAFFGLRNAGKSTLVNAFCGQEVAIVNDTPGTTTDPVSKAMEILPLGPCLVTDTAGLDDEGELGKLRVEKSLKALESADIAVWVNSAADSESDIKRDFLADCAKRRVTVFEFNRGEGAAELRQKIAAVAVEPDPGLLDGLVGQGDRVICVCPIDESAPKGRLILPQVQVIRECLDRHLPCSVVQTEELEREVKVEGEQRRKVLVVTDSQAFREVKAIVAAAGGASAGIGLTSFSILFARQKGDLEELTKGLAVARTLKDGDRVLVAEACTHHRQCNDIGTTKIPKALMKLSGARPAFEFCSGNDFRAEGYRLVVHCGGCMLTRRTMLARIARAKAAGTPIVNYGLLLNAALGNG